MHQESIRDDTPREPWVKGQYIVWFVKDNKFDTDKIKEICDNCSCVLADCHLPERGVVTFDEAKADEVMEKLYGWPEYIRSVSRNHYLHLC